MPTGYTADVADGTVTSFREFALRCARNFGALILMRDAPADAPIPERFEPSDYHQRQIATARTALATLPGLSGEECERRAAAEHEEQILRWNGYRTNRAATAARYRAMLEKVKQWQPPTLAHEEMKRFMLQQLTESLKFDCEWESPVPVAQTGAAWRQQQLAQAEKDLAYHGEEYAAELARTASRNEWIAALRASLEKIEKIEGSN